MPNLSSWRTRPTVWLALTAFVAAVEWLRNPAVVWVAATLAVALLALALEMRQTARSAGGSSVHRWLPGLAVLVLGLTMANAEWRIAPVGANWPAERERRVNAAFQRLSGELRAAVTRADQLSAAAVPLGKGDREAAFAELGRVLPRDQAEMAVVILESTGVPWAWAGRHRLPP